MGLRHLDSCVVFAKAGGCTQLLYPRVIKSGRTRATVKAIRNIPAVHCPL